MTGNSGVGKSTVCARLKSQGELAIDVGRTVEEAADAILAAVAKTANYERPG
ncbi:hypothetical protein [Rathayibacter soli]|uniref:hypothetical protein n=1 Tax=Rathayibacter soli TaxID=3144168 RepID=UPI0027E45072|nr:hypothetical protein [Glaciibacter superstes]